ncbi:MAG TPA: polymer-forming cytoskeletal protein [Candidatus Binataceae bacterium]|nr:polymer-forming cytoskeletal protein [Candidatus Binataceae bacterium]
MATGKQASSCISKSTRISGKLEFLEPARIEGQADGDIAGDEIEIGPSAVVRARIMANKLTIGGQVNGEIVALQRVEVLPTARLHCTITTPALVITEGAQFDGDCRMPGNSSPQPHSNELNEISVPVWITNAQRAKLKARGFSDDDIAQMNPSDADRILGVQ